MKKNRPKPSRPASPSPSLRLEYLDPSELAAHPGNWRRHPPRQLKALKGLIDRVGWAGALLYNERTGRLLDGHARKELFEGKGKVPVLIGSWSEATERELLALLDPLRSMAEVDGEKLDALFALVAGKVEGIGDELADMGAVLRPPISLRVLPVEVLKPHAQNYRTHPPEQLAHLAASVREQGFYRNVVVARDGTILAGHGVVEAVKSMGATQVPVVVLDVGPNDPKAMKVIAGDNEIAKLAEVDDRALTELLKEIMGTEAAHLAGTGVDPKSLAELLFVTRPAGELESRTAAAAAAGVAEADRPEEVFTLIMLFRTPAARQEFMSRTGLSLPPDALRTPWPPAPLEESDRAAS